MLSARTTAGRIHNCTKFELLLSITARGVWSRVLGLPSSKLLQMHHYTAYTFEVSSILPVFMNQLHGFKDDDAYK